MSDDPFKQLRAALGCAPDDDGELVAVLRVELRRRPDGTLTTGATTLDGIARGRMSLGMRRRLDCLAAGLRLPPPGSDEPLPAGIGAMAARENVSRQAYAKSVRRATCELR